VGNASIYTGSDSFKAEQLSRIFGVKVPSFEQCHISTQEGGNIMIAQDEDWAQPALRISREHALAWNVNGTIISAPMTTTWWIPCDHAVIMRYGHSVNPSIQARLNFHRSRGLIESSSIG
jgi:hypothetical protein